MRITRLLALATADITLLTTLRPQLGDLAQYLTGPAQAVSRMGADRAAVALTEAALWCVGVWVAVGLMACATAALPGARGRIGDRLARRVLPTALYRLLAGAAGLGVLLSPAVASAAPHPAPTASAPAPQWPSDSPLPPPAWPATPVPRPATPRHTADRTPAPRAAAVVVQPGDTLWSITAEHLPADAGPKRVAREWPRWFAANRAVVGADPDLIRPGQVLHAPAPRQAQQP